MTLSAVTEQAPKEPWDDKLLRFPEFSRDSEVEPVIDGIPAVICVGAHDYTVLVTTEFAGVTPEEFASDEFQQLGEVNPVQLTIKVAPDQAPTIEAATVLHECLHAIDFDRSLALEEYQVRSITNGILALLHDNLDLFDYLKRAARS